MVFQRTFPCLLLALTFATGVQAQDAITLGADPLIAPAKTDNWFGYTVGLSATARFGTSDSFDHAENEIEGFVELTFGDFHTGFIATSLYDDPNDDVEFEINLGYGREFGNGMSWDLTYGYLFKDSSDGHSEEITATLGFPVGPRTEGAFAVILAPDTGKSDQEFGFETALNDRWSLVGLIGNSDRDDNVYGEIGAVYAINDQTSFEVLYEDKNDSGGLLGFTISYEFGG